MNDQITVVQTADSWELEDLDDETSPRTWHVTCFDIVRDGEVIASLQVTPIDICVFEVTTDVGVVARVR